MMLLGFKEGFSQEFLLTDDREEKAWENDCIMSASTIDDASSSKLPSEITDVILQLFTLCTGLMP